MTPYRPLLAAVVLVLLTGHALGHPTSGPPYNEEHSESVTIDCAVAHPNGIRGDFCANLTGEGTDLTVAIDAHLTTLVVRIEVPSDEGIATPGTSWRVWWMDPPGGVIDDTRGPSGTQTTQTFDSGAAWNHEDRQATAHVELDTDQTQLAFGKIVHVHFGFFYNGAVVPAGYVPGA